MPTRRTYARRCLCVPGAAALSNGEGRGISCRLLWLAGAELLEGCAEGAADKLVGRLLAHSAFARAARFDRASVRGHVGVSRG
jgi:hypothetical protein